MKILTIVSSGYEQGGVESTVVKYTDSYRSQGHDARIISSDVRPDLQHYSDYEFKATSKIPLKNKLDEVLNISAYMLTRKVLKDFKPDIVILHTMQRITPSVLFLLKNYPTIQCVHGPEAFTKSLLQWHIDRKSFKDNSFDINSLNTIGKIRYFFLRYPNLWLYKYALKNADTFLVFSEYMKNLMIRDGYDSYKISYLKMGIDFPAQRIKSPKSSDKHIIGYAGRIEEYKGVDNLVKSMPAILKSFPDTKLFLAGEGSFINDVQEAVKKLGIEKSTVFLGHLTAQQMIEFYSSISILVVPSIWPEAFGKVGVEAMNSWTPVIASDVGGVRDWLHNQKNGLLVSPGEPDEISNAVIQLFSDRKLYKQYSFNSSKTSGEFSMESFMNNFDNLITETINMKINGNASVNTK